MSNPNKVISQIPQLTGFLRDVMFRYDEETGKEVIFQDTAHSHLFEGGRVYPREEYEAMDKGTMFLDHNSRVTQQRVCILDALGGQGPGITHWVFGEGLASWDVSGGFPTLPELARTTLQNEVFRKSIVGNFHWLDALGGTPQATKSEFGRVFVRLEQSEANGSTLREHSLVGGLEATSTADTGLMLIWVPHAPRVKRSTFGIDRSVDFGFVTC